MIAELLSIPLLRTGKLQVRDFTLEEMQTYALANMQAQRQRDHAVCLSRSQSLSNSGQHSAANEAHKCASAVLHGPFVHA